MRKSIISILAVSVGIIPATAYAGEPYVGASAGINLPSDSKNRGATNADIPATADFPAIPSGTSVDWRTELNNGLDLNLYTGYRLDNGIRLELQGFYNNANVDRHRDLAVGGAIIDGVDSAVLTRGAAAATNPTVGDILSTDEGRIKNYGLMANALYDIKVSDKFMPYVGAGVGFTRQDVEYQPSAVDVVNDKKTRFTYQGIAGATFKLSPSFEMFGQYTYRNAERGDYDVNLLPATLGVKSEQSIVNVGFRIPFGG